VDQHAPGLEVGERMLPSPVGGPEVSRMLDAQFGTPLDDGPCGCATEVTMPMKKTTGAKGAHIEPPSTVEDIVAVHGLLYVHVRVAVSSTVEYVVVGARAAVRARESASRLTGGATPHCVVPAFVVGAPQATGGLFQSLAPLHDQEISITCPCTSGAVVGTVAADRAHAALYGLVSSIGPRDS
jgi:hypothetical protein